MIFLVQCGTGHIVLGRVYMNGKREHKTVTELKLTNSNKLLEFCKTNMHCHWLQLFFSGINIFMYVTRQESLIFPRLIKTLSCRVACVFNFSRNRPKCIKNQIIRFAMTETAISTLLARKFRSETLQSDTPLTDNCQSSKIQPYYSQC